MEDIQTRINNVTAFLHRMHKPTNIKYDIVPISDPFGPTRDDPKLDALVGSVETCNGCDAGIFIGNIKLHVCLHSEQVEKVDGFE
jgi:phosphopantetheine adenylyltransferase